MAIQKGVKWLIGGCGCLSLLGLIGAGVIVYYGMQMTPSHVVPGHEVSQKYIDDMNELELFDPGEKLLFFYSDSLFDVKDSVYTLTDRRLVLYSRFWPVQKRQLEFHEIETVELRRFGETLGDNRVIMKLTSGEDLDFPLSGEQDGDIDFIDQLQKFVDGAAANK